jgi:hypothetical protein
VEYKQCLDLTKSIQIIKERREAKEAEEARRVEVKPTPVAPVVEKQPEPVPEEKPLQAPVVETPEEEYEMKFAVII